MYDKLLTKQEDKVMELFWNLRVTLTSRDILELLRSEDWTGSYVYSVLRSLEKKNMISVCGEIRSKTQTLKEYVACISKEEFYVRLALSNHVNVRKYIDLAIRTVAQENPRELERIYDELIQNK